MSSAVSIPNHTFPGQAYSSKQFTSNCAPSFVLFVCVEVLQPSQPNWVMSSAVSLPNHTRLLGRQSSKPETDPS